MMLPTRYATGAIAAIAFAVAASPADAQNAGYTPHRVYDTRTEAFVDFESFAHAVAAADVVFFGELHGNVAGHRMQHVLLEALQRRGGGTLSLEMFERDAATLLAAYVAGDTAEAELLAHGRPWPRYATDYRPLVEHARLHGWLAIAANVPRELASLVAGEGLDAVHTLPSATRALIARDLRCPDDSYRVRFLAEIQRHPMGPPAAPEEEAARAQRFYEAQCIKDETMAESIAEALRAAAPTPIVHVTGSFHSDYGDGIAARVARRQPHARMLSVTLVPVADLIDADPGPHAQRADFLLFTLDSAAASPEDEAAARQTLLSFFDALAAGRFADAVRLYGGDYDHLAGMNPDLPATDQAALLQAGCLHNGLVCLPVGRIVGVDSTGAGEYRFAIEFVQPDGTVFRQGPCCGEDPDGFEPISVFSYTVRHDRGFHVLELPPYVP